MCVAPQGEKFSIIVPTIPSNDVYERDPEVRQERRLLCLRWQERVAAADDWWAVSVNNNVACSAVQIWDLIVVGAGVAGSALAYRQGKVSCGKCRAQP